MCGCLCQCGSSLNLICDVVRPPLCVCVCVLYTGTEQDLLVNSALAARDFRLGQLWKHNFVTRVMLCTTTASAPPLIITLYQSWQSFYLSDSLCFNFEIPSSLIYPSFSFYMFIPPFFLQATAKLPQQTVFWVFLVGGGGGGRGCCTCMVGGLTGSWGSFRSSYLGWCKPIEQILDQQHSDVHAYTYSLQAFRSDSSLFTPAGPSA